MDNSNLYQLLNALIPVLGVILTAFVIPLIASKVGEANLAKYLSWARIVVGAMEAIYSESGKGKEKKHQAVLYLQNMFGDKLSNKEIDLLVENAVNELNMVAKSINK